MPIVIGTLMLTFVFAPFPFGMGMIYPIKDSLRGHPEGAHGTQPSNFVGLWIRDESIMFDFVGEVFYLMPDGRFAGKMGMTSRSWHFDDNTLYVDSVSRCGNCYSGNVTTSFNTQFVGTNELLITSQDPSSQRGIGGTYRRFEITEALKSQLKREMESDNEAESFKARSVLDVIEKYEETY
ncbi:MAG: hypothetical protein KF824_05395 [Fimbriimonadaceae bacterium]|nr:MAG: hypothetical protein KF824_05395 [Fimbriimonadaceae bacterium]